MRQTRLAILLLLAVQVMAQDSSKVIFVPAKQLISDSRKTHEQSPNTTWIIYVDNPSYSAEVVRRTAPYRAELHERVTDIWYVIEGEGTLVTDGSLVQPIHTEPEELRGQSISGGEERHIAPGDFIRIPTGVPHWVKKVDGKEIVYLVVKVATSK